MTIVRRLCSHLRKVCSGIARGLESVGPGVLQSALEEEDQEMTANDIGATTQLIYILHTAANNLRQVNEQTETAAVTPPPLRHKPMV